MTGRLAEKPADAAAFLTPPDSVSSSMCTACPQLSHVRPLLATTRHPLTRGVAKRLALVQVMLVRGHYGLEIILGGSARKALPVWRYSPAIRFS